LGLFLTLSFILHFSSEELPNDFCRSLLFFLFYVVYFSMLTYVSLGHAILRLKGFKTGERMGWIAGATLAGMLVTIVIQPAPSPVPVWSEVTITPLNQRDPKAQGSEIRIIRVVNHDRRLPWSLFEHDGDWQLLDGGVVMLAPTGASGSLRWSGWVRGALRVVFIQHSGSGMVQVTLMPLWVWSEVTITSLNQRDPEWQGSEVWLLRAFNSGHRLSLTNLKTMVYDPGG